MQAAETETKAYGLASVWYTEATSVWSCQRVSSARPNSWGLSSCHYGGGLLCGVPHDLRGRQHEEHHEEIPSEFENWVFLQLTEASI